MALKRNQIPIETYYASEIDKHAIKVSQKNHPEIIHLGSIVGLKPPEIDLLIGGSPCQDLSIAKKGRKGLEGERSGLFWEYVRIWKEAKPKYFILENVNSMPKEAKAEITKIMGVEPIMINASLVSAQSRKRLFWTNIPVKGLPEDRKIYLKDVLEVPIVSEYYSNKLIKLGHVGRTDGQANRVYSPDGKSATLSSGGAGLIKINGAAIRGNAKIKTENGIKAVDKLDVRKDEKANSLTTTFHNKLALVSDESQIRKLTPIECERLQGLPDNYTDAISNTQRYKCLGNAFNVDVICFILGFTE
jgi:DNA-cytosine methyltransferase